MNGSTDVRCIHLLDTDGFAGTERHVLLLVRRLRLQGVDAVIGCRGRSPLEAAAVEQGLPVVALAERPGVRMLLGLFRQVRRSRPDLIHAHNGRTQLMGAIVNQVTGAPLFATQHFLKPQFTTYRGAKRALANGAHAWVNGRVTRYAAVSEAARLAMLERERLPGESVTTVPNGIDPLVLPSPERLAALRAELTVPPGVPMVVTVARLVAEKGIGTLIDAVVIVRRTVPDAVFVVVGEGDLATPLADRARQLGVDGVVRFAGFRADATDVIAAADVFVLPSPAEPFGLVLLEAMALGRPVVATAAGGPLEIVVDRQTGRLVPPSDPAALAGAIVDLLQDPSARERMGAAGLQRFHERFTADRMAAATVAMYASGRAVLPDVGGTAVA